MNLEKTIETLLTSLLEKRESQKGNNLQDNEAKITDDRQQRYKEEFLKLKEKNEIEHSSKNGNKNKAMDTTDTKSSPDFDMTDGSQLVNAENIKKSEFYCDICQLYASSASTFSSHMNGTKHFKNSRKRYLEGMLKGLRDKAGQNNQEDTMNTAEISSMEEKEKSEMDEKFKQLNNLGLEFIEEIGGGNMQFRCSLCERDFTCASVIIDHLLGKKHKHKYKKCQDDPMEGSSPKRRRKNEPDKEEKLKAKEEFWKTKRQETLTNVQET